MSYKKQQEWREKELLSYRHHDHTSVCDQIHKCEYCIWQDCFPCSDCHTTYHRTEKCYFELNTKIKPGFTKAEIMGE